MKASAFFLISLLICTAQAFADPHLLSQKEFLDGVMDGQIDLDHSPMYILPPAGMDYVLKKQKEKFPLLQQEMLYVYHRIDNDYMYQISYDYSNLTCLFRMEPLDRMTHKWIPEGIDPVGKSIDKKYCEKVYGIKLP